MNDEKVASFSVMENADNKIKDFDISPSAALLAAQIGQELYIRILNQVDRQQHKQNLSYQKSIAFMPIYLDEDYSFEANLERYDEEQMREEEEQRKQLSIDIQASLRAQLEKQTGRRASVSFATKQHQQEDERLDRDLFADMVTYNMIDKQIHNFEKIKKF